MRKDIKNKLLQKKESAAVYVDFILKHTDLSYEQFEDYFTEYVCDKFVLEKNEINTDDFYKICAYSVEKIAGLPTLQRDAALTASRCGGATTAMNKKVLFLLSVNREYSIQITPEESMKIDTFTQLKKLVYEKVILNRSAEYSV